MRKFLNPLMAAALAATAFFAVPCVAAAEDYKIGVLNVERVLQQSNAAKAAHDRLEQEFKGRNDDIVKKEQDVRATAQQLENDRPTLSADEFASRQRALDLRTRDVQRLRQQFAEDLRARQFEELDKLKERLDKVLTRFAQERHYDLILQDAAYVGRSVDITDDVLKALEATPQ
ncbi:MAG: OmpH family outer membrane protein [Rudaea sp.]